MRVMRAMRAISVSVVYVPTYQHTNMPKACQFFHLGSQGTKAVPIFQLGVPTYQETCQFFNYLSKELENSADVWRRFRWGTRD